MEKLEKSLPFITIQNLTEKMLNMLVSGNKKLGHQQYKIDAILVQCELFMSPQLETIRKEGAFDVEMLFEESSPSINFIPRKKNNSGGSFTTTVSNKVVEDHSLAQLT